MQKYRLFLIAEKLSENASKDELATVRWPYTIYHALLAGQGKHSEPEWSIYHHWNIDHQYRSHKAAVKKKGDRLVSLRVKRLNRDQARLKATFSKADGSRTTGSCDYNRNDFTPLLWTIRNPNGDALLSGTFERDGLYEASLGIPFDSETESAPAPNTHPGKGKDVKSTEKTVKPKRGRIVDTSDDGDPHPKFKALWRMLGPMRSVYRSTSDPRERSFMETVVGAAVFYLPTSVDHFSGHMSRAAIAGYLEGRRIVKDHIFPRKLAGRTLLESEFTLDELVHIHHTKLAIFMYVSAEENSLLVNYYENHTDHDQAMKALGIEKFPSATGERFRDHKEKREFMKSLAKLNGREPSLDQLEKRLKEFKKRK
jgi:hypothetical protein